MNIQETFASTALAGLLVFSGCFGASDASTKEAPSPEDESPAESPAPAMTEAPAPAPGKVAGPLKLLSGKSEASDLSLASVGGHRVPVTIFRPIEATPDSRVPVLLHSHGWSGSRSLADDSFRAYHEGGFGVVSIDMRGHGDARSTSEARVHHMDYEIKDVQAVIDYVSGLPWVLMDAGRDPRLGALGGSYGGGYQLLTAAVDGRIDALAPEITWNSLPESLAPTGAPKSAWIDLLYGAGNALARVHPDIHQAYAIAQSQNRIADGTGPYEPNLKAQFLRSSPVSYPDAIDKPTLLIQGANDTLFNFNQAAHNYLQIKATGAPVRFVTHLQGHLIPQLQKGAGPSPCGPVSDLVISWYQAHLLGLPVDTGPEVCFALEDGSRVYASQFPVPEAPLTAFAPKAEVSISKGVPRFSVAVDILKVKEPTVVLGIPMLSGTLTTASTDAIVYWTLDAVSASGARHVLNDQVQAQRFAGPATDKAFTLELAGIGARLSAGDSLLLVASTSNDQFFHNGDRVPGTVVFKNLKLELPILPTP